MLTLGACRWMVPCPEMLCALVWSSGVAGEPHAGCGCRGWWVHSSSLGRQALDSIYCNKSEISPVCAGLSVLVEYTALLVLSSEQEETRAGKDELGCRCSFGKLRYFPRRLKLPLSLINKNAKSSLAEQK